MRSSQRPVLGAVVAGSIVAGSMLLSPIAQGASRTSPGPGTVVDTSLAPRVINAPFTVRLEDQLLASLRYLPVTFVPAGTSVPVATTTSTSTTTTVAGTTTSTSSTTTSSTTTTTLAPTTTTTAPRKVATTPKIVRGSFVWRFKTLTPFLHSQWRVGSPNVVLTGALMHFQSVHGLATTGNMDTATWQTLLLAAKKGQVDPTSYNYVVVSQVQPQKLRLYVNGRHTYTSFVNTGISVAPTENGTFPVYLRYAVTTMSGTNPNGTKYHDPGIPWTSYFHGGDALHGFIRSSYGWPQSLGCVEMPFANAAVVWPFTPIGTLVTVQQK